jgi:hypothetical protein
MKATLPLFAATAVFAARDDTHLLHDELFNSFSFKQSHVVSNCDSLLDSFIVEDSGKWTTVSSLAGKDEGYAGKKEIIEAKMSELVAKGDMGYSWFMDSNPYYMHEMNWGGLVKGWATFYRDKMADKSNYGTVFVNCDAKLNKQNRLVPNTDDHMRYCNTILHFFRIALLSLKVEPRLYVLYGRHAKLFKATYDRTLMEQTISNVFCYKDDCKSYCDSKNACEGAKASGGAQRPHEYGFHWESVTFDERGSNIEGALVYFAGGNLHDLMGLVGSMEKGDPDEDFAPKVRQFSKLFGQILVGWKSKRLMLGGHSAGVMWQSPKNSLNFLYFGMSGDPGIGSVEYEQTSNEGNGDKVLCGSADEPPKYDPVHFGSYNCSEMLILQVGGTTAAPSCTPQVWQKCGKGEQLSVDMKIGTKSYMLVKPTIDAMIIKQRDGSQKWSVPYPKTFDGRYNKTNELMHWAFRPHCCESPDEQPPDENKTVKPHCIDHIPAVLAMFNDKQYEDYRAPIVFTTEGQALKVDPGAAKQKFQLFDAYAAFGAQPLCLQKFNRRDWEKCVSPPGYSI